MNDLRGVRLTSIIYMEYMETGEIIFLNNGIRLAEELLEKVAENRNRASLLCNLSCMLGGRYERSGSVQDLEDAARRAEEALLVALPDEPDRARILNNLGNILDLRAQRLGDLSDLNMAIIRSQEGLEATTPNDPERAQVLCNLGLKLLSRFERLGNLDDLEKAIARVKEALEATNPFEPSRAGIMQNLSNMLEQRHTRLGATEDLEQAVVLAEQALAATPSYHPDRAPRSSCLGIRLYNRYKQLGRIEDLQQAIRRSQEALLSIPSDHPARIGILNTLGTVLDSRYQRLGNLEDLQQAIARVMEAIADISLDHPERTRLLNSLSNKLFKRFERLGAPEDLEDSIKWSEQALAIASLDYIVRADILSGLGGKLSARYELEGALEDLEEAIRLGEEALTAIPLDYPARAALLNNLAQSLELKYRHAGDMEVLEQSIIRSIEAIAETPLEHYHRPSLLRALADKLSRKASRLGTLEDLQEAIEWQEEAMEVTPPGHPNRAHILSGMAATAFTRYRLLKESEDCERAITLAEEALGETPHNHPIRATLLNDTGAKRISRHLETKSGKDFAVGLHMYLEACGCDMSPPVQRVIGAARAAILLNNQKRWQESRSLYDIAIKMLPKVSPRSLGRDNQQNQLSEFPGLASIAASVALNAGADASDCLRLLEFGRGIMMGFAIDCRSDLTDLQLESPEICNKFNRLCIEIDSPLVETYQGSDESESQSRNKALSRRKRAIDEMEETLAHIRQLTGFEGFLLPPSPGELMMMAKDGPIITVNCTLWRSDAIIVTTSSVKALPLPKLVATEAIERVPMIRDLIRGTLRTSASRNTKMREMLLWLWDVAVKPILEELQLLDLTSDAEKPHIWWIGVNVMSLAPFHAAGDYSLSSTHNALNRVISSYIPSIKALSYARQKELKLFSGPDARLLLVSMATTPGQSSLGGMAQEAKEIVGIIKEKTTVVATLLDRPSAAEVLAEIPSCHAIHFACHGVSDSNNPSNSHLLLLNHDSSGSEIADKLTVKDISNKNIKHAQIAYLSACCTANNPSIWLADEAVHIASGFQLAGFSHVLGTLWQVNDAASLQIAKDFYSFLFNRQGDGHRRVSTAFHGAVQRLQAQYPNQPIKWAPFIHIGA